MAKQGNASTPRNARTLAEFGKMTTVGAAIFGKVTEYGSNSNGDFVVFAPAAFRANANEQFAKFGELAVGLSTDLASKVTEQDAGKLLLFVLVALKPTAVKGHSPMKIFNVIDLTREQVGELFTTNAMPEEWTRVPESAVASRAKGAAEPDLF